ncbi:L-rhamnose mutarotase [Agromyces atrinae]|uniref:L-rhamnose mutarotase n=2 Tax=Agromyces atrinae TaxID=592376 RepID=A0A4Q2M3A5_9MICO|nr:L-rhamnose mutarotase [Agromyces atrinae]NYD68271.1 L-rhamnose mutarotase [Agromyces atrinae]RXZ85667.1 L-rhamnose mutarotase [Agromyces atrinae]
MAARLVPEKRDEYLALHRMVWPQVEKTISESGIRNFTIFSLDDVIIAYYEYVGDDFDADQQRMASDPITQEWWTHTAPCQRPLREDSTAPNWEIFDEVWHLD